MKKTNIFTSIFMTLALSILSSLILAIIYEVTRNWVITYVIGYLITIAILGKWFKNDLIDNAKSFKDDLQNNWLNILIVTLILTILLYTSNYLVVKYMNGLATNEIMTRNQLKNSPILMGISTVLLAPIVEEIIYRLPYKRIKNHKLLNFFVYSLVFALAHIALTSITHELLYLIPYLFLSMSIGYSFYKTDNIYMSMIIHILNNFINVMIILIL